MSAERKIVVDCSAPNKERELAVTESAVGNLFALVRAGTLTSERAEEKVAQLLDYATEVVAAPDQVTYVELDEQDLAQRALDLDAERTRVQLLVERGCATRLRESDWTQLPDADLDEAERTAWTAYRQALRNLPTATSDPFDPDWPAPPDLK